MSCATPLENGNLALLLSGTPRRTLKHTRQKSGNAGGGLLNLTEVTEGGGGDEKGRRRSYLLASSDGVCSRPEQPRLDQVIVEGSVVPADVRQKLVPLYGVFQ